MSKIANFFLSTKRQLLFCAVSTVLLLVLLALFSPSKVGVVLYKLLLTPLGGAIGVWLWFALVPYLNPSRFLKRDWRSNPESDQVDEADFPIVDGYFIVFCVCAVCAALAFIGGMLAVAWGL